ncbi:MAG: 3-keto-disaccharide hydrolase [Agriterribacter sp.]
MNKRSLIPVLCAVLLLGHAYAQDKTDFTAIALNSLDAFTVSGDNWIVSSDAEGDLEKEGILKPIAGSGVLVNNQSKKNKAHLVTKENFGDVELELDFMMSKGANSGVYLQGRYEVQLFDSWAKANPTYVDCGGIYQRWNNTTNSGYEGIAPLVNVARAPGLWQHLKIKFRAPRFNAQGVKTENAVFEEVYLNGVLVQQQASVTGPTRASYFEDEKTVGPLMIQGDHGNVAIRNIRYRALNADNSTPEKIRLVNPIIVTPENKPYLLRSFLSYGKAMVTHAISVGSPNQLNYSYDLKRGALLQVWRGQFADATDLWYERGEPYQRVVPMGSLIPLSDAPSVAALQDAASTPWPESASFDDVVLKGYTLDTERMPTFRYTLQNASVSDKVAIDGTTGITRTISVTGASAPMYHRVIAAKTLKQVKKGWYLAADESLYIRFDEKAKPVIRTAGSGQELLIPVDNTAITYSLIW